LAQPTLEAFWMTKSGYANALFYVFCLDTARHFLGEGLDEGHPGRKGDDGELDLKRDRGGGFRRQLLSASFRAIATKTYPAKKEGNTVCLTN
ncbi:MAG: hypothetical protein DME50_18160, partial [Verrucomicrobia bacterium]